MGKLDGAVRRLDALTVGKMGERLRYEIRYARRVSETLGGRHDALIPRAIEAARYAAERAGVQVGDYVISAGGMDIASSQDVLTARERYHLGDEMPMTLWRDGRSVEVTLVLQEASTEN